MLNLKFGISALLLEIGAWTGPALLEGRTDAALSSYLLVHAGACLMLSLFLLPFLSGDQARPRAPVLGLMAVFSYAVPIVGFIGVIAAVVVLRIYRSPASQGDFESLRLPEFDRHQRMQGSFRQAGLRSFLGNSQAPMQTRMRAMVALQHVSGRIASPLLRTVLSDPSEDLRLLAYGMLDTLEKRINRTIDSELDALRQAKLEEGDTPGPLTVESAFRLSDLYWELVYQELVQGDLRDHAVKESLQYCDQVLAQQPDHPQLNLRRGRLLHLLGRVDEAEAAYALARDLGLPATRVLPYQAELCFERRDFAQTRELVQQLNQWRALPRLRPILDYWSAP
ncbi:tetratricopeptide repeat protein [Acidovorax sp. SUPP3334]|uniref:tetratricopeptide repeat protein n=1 Tax=Acidovorax sp. SUPP3334 TaxID=2920881 RepID=UPI0023DE4693|nr:tetratricopeptide repeat protein [Acidovorax sp. SUPP3334]GKT21473.1 membrane protein [Acidovorax sp. SUPP3334]